MASCWQGHCKREEERWNENACVKERRVVRVCNISSHGLALHERKWEEKNRASRAKKKWKQNRTTQSKAVIEDEKNEEEEAAAVIYHLAFFFPFIVLFGCLLFSHSTALSRSYSFPLIRLSFRNCSIFEKNQWLFIDAISQCVDTFIMLVLIVSVCFAFSCSRTTYAYMYKNTGAICQIWFAV